MNQVEAIFLAEATEGVEWQVSGGTLRTALNEPYLIRLEIETERIDVEPLDLLGSAASFVIRRDLSENVYGGIVSSARTLQQHGSTVRASVVVEPALAVLRHGKNSRIFQEKSVPTILGEVLTAALAPYGRTAELHLTRTYPLREYTVQYEESDFELVHRLMEEEGILYYFDPGDEGVEKLVLIDAPQQHPAIEGGMVEYSAVATGGGIIGQEYVRAFHPTSTVVGTEVRTRHFDWTHPSVILEGQATSTREGESPDGGSFGPVRESYQHDEQLTLSEYSLVYRAHDLADQQRIRREAQARDALVFQAESTVSAIRAGVRLELNGHPSIALNAPYVVIGAVHSVGSHARAIGGKESHYQNRFTAVQADLPYRPRRTRQRPRVHGLQTAIVTGPPGEEIHTDERGRVKVQFHWDRLGQMNEHTTCWIRCMQTWSGNGWGAFVLPRVGMEVVVSFLDGDLDRPIVTGCVYNGDNAVPYEMPARKMVSTFKTNSYPGGEGYNELRFDDTKGQEEIWIHGEKDWNTVIENDLNRQVLHDETQHVSHDRTRNVGHDETVTVGNDRTKTVGVNETLNVGANRSRTVGANESVAIGANQTVTVLTNQTTKVGEHREVKAGATHTLTAGVSLELRCGQSRMLMEADGTITITGTEFRFGASGEVWVAGTLIHLN